MSKKKKWILPLVVVLVICMVFGAIAVIVKQVNAKTVSVVPVSELMSQYDYFGTGMQESIGGTITTNVTQKVRLDNDSIVEEVNVKVGDKVSEGDRLMSYDTTLTELELQIQKLTKENNEQKLEKAKQRLESLENGGPIEDSDSDNDRRTSPLDDKDDPDDNLEPGDEASLEDKAVNVMRVAAFRAIGLSGVSPETSPEAPDETGEPDISETPAEMPDVTETPAETPTPEPTETPSEDDGLTAYVVLDDSSVPYKGTGTADDPYRFICDQNEEYILVMGTFLNKMAGYNAEGTVKESEDAPFWYRLEFHKDNTVADMDKPEDSLVGYYVRKGAAEPVEPDDEKHFSVEGAIMPDDGIAVLTPTPTETPDDFDLDDGDDWGDYDEDTDESTMSREEAIKSQKVTVKSLELEIRANAIQISKLEKKLEKQIVVAAIDGVVKVVGDPISGESDGEAFIEVYSDDGFYVQGTISELMLGKIDTGQVLKVQAWESGLTFQAEIKEISQFPSDSSGNYSYYGGSNPNVSYYPFIAKVMGDAQPKNGESVEMTLELNQEEETGIKLDVAFVKTEDGQSYVYKEADGRLKKQIVKMTKISDGYMEVANVTSGLSEDDKIAFPYAKSAKEGAKTKDGTLDEVYGYY